MNPEPDVDKLFREPSAEYLEYLASRYGKLFAARALYLARSIGLRIEITIREMQVAEREARRKNRV